jgi:hypothetical protein
MTKHIGEFLLLYCELVKENHVVKQAKTYINENRPCYKNCLQVVVISMPCMGPPLYRRFPIVKSVRAILKCSKASNLWLGWPFAAFALKLVTPLLSSDSCFSQVYELKLKQPLTRPFLQLLGSLSLQSLVVTVRQDYCCWKLLKKTVMWLVSQINISLRMFPQ